MSWFKAEIFTYLPFKDRIRSERVCRRWKAILEAFAWRKTCDLSYWTFRNQPRCHLAGEDAKIAEDEIASVTVRCGKYLRSLNLEGLCITRRPRYLTFNFINGCSHLGTLHIGCETLTHRALVKIGANCPLLEHFTFLGNLIGNPPGAIHHFLQCCQRLREIVLKVPHVWCSNTVLTCVAVLPGSLKSIRFTGCRFSEVALDKVTKMCPILRILQLEHYAFETSSPLSGNAFAACQELTTLCIQLDTHLFSRIGECIGTLLNLLELSLGMAPNITLFSVRF